MARTAILGERRAAVCPISPYGEDQEFACLRAAFKEVADRVTLAPDTAPWLLNVLARIRAERAVSPLGEGENVQP